MRYSNRGPVEFFRSNELSSTPFFLSTPFHHPRPPAAFFRPFSFFFPFFTLPTARSTKVERTNEGRKEGGNVTLPLRVDRFASRRERYRDQNPDPVFQKIVGPSPSLSPSPSLFISPPPPPYRAPEREAGTVGPQRRGSSSRGSSLFMAVSFFEYGG